MVSKFEISLFASFELKAILEDTTELAFGSCFNPVDPPSFSLHLLSIDFSSLLEPIPIMAFVFLTSADTTEELFESFFKPFLDFFFP